jgi:oligopeptide/dipeptide ABC transporter ATP-binding protein
MIENELLRIENLKTYYTTYDGIVKAVDSVDLKLDAGETLGLVGESGCGKSTLGKSVIRLIQKPGNIVDGKILFEGEDLLNKSDDEMKKIRGGEMSMIFQNPLSSLNPVFKIGNQVAEVIKIHTGLNESEIQEKTAEILEKVGIADAQNRMSAYPHQFSGGMRQRVMIAIAFACNPKLVIADEPTTNLDVTIQAQILELMKGMQKEYGSSVILISHDFGVISEASDKVAVMYAGKVVEYSDIISVVKDPIHPYTRELLKSIPRLSVDSKERLSVIEGKVPDLINPPKGCRFHPRCKYQTENCRTEEPPLLEIKPGHYINCYNIE